MVVWRCTLHASEAHTKSRAICWLPRCAGSCELSHCAMCRPPPYRCGATIWTRQAAASAHRVSISGYSHGRGGGEGGRRGDDAGGLRACWSRAQSSACAGCSTAGRRCRCTRRFALYAAGLWGTWGWGPRSSRCRWRERSHGPGSICGGTRGTTSAPVRSSGWQRARCSRQLDEAGTPTAGSVLTREL